VETRSTIALNGGTAAVRDFAKVGSGGALPQGSDRLRVEEFLTQHRVDYTYYPRSSSDGKRIPATLDAYTQYAGTPSLRCKLHFTFSFDDEDRFAGYQDKYVCAP
jgi:hypothetical protein